MSRARWHLAPRTSVRLIGWLPVAGSAVAVALLLTLNATLWRGQSAPLLPTARVVETFVPLVVGLHAAFLLSAEDEPSLELLLACPRPLAWALLERVAVMAAQQGSVALGGSLVGLALPGAEGSHLAIARWLTPCAWFGGVALFTTQLTRQGVFGALLVMLLWGGTFFGGDALLTRWPFLWPLHAYLQPEAVAPNTYVLNRSGLILAGFILTALAARLTRDEERMLGVRKVRGVRP